MTIVLENEAHDDSGPAASVRAIVEAIGSPHFGTQYDPCNYYHANEEPYPAAYEIVKPYVRYVHLKGGCHYDPETRPRDKKGGTMRGSDDRYIGYTRSRTAWSTPMACCAGWPRTGTTDLSLWSRTSTPRRRSTTTGSTCPTCRSECERCKVGSSHGCRVTSAVRSPAACRVHRGENAVSNFVRVVGTRALQAPHA